jgi:hypothetical protein
MDVLLTKKRVLEFSRVNRVAVAFQNSNHKNKPMAAIDFRDPEIMDFFRVLQKLEVTYIIVGGFAIAFHGYVRATSDLDIWLRDDPENIERFKEALKKSGVKGLDEIRSFELIPGFTQFQIGDSGFVVEPFKSLKTLKEYDFDAAYLRADSGQFEDITFKVIHAKDLLREKESTNRPKDQGDIEHLRSLG